MRLLRPCFCACAGHLTAKVIGPEGELPVQVTSSGGKYRHSVIFHPTAEGKLGFLTYLLFQVFFIMVV